MGAAEAGAVVSWQGANLTFYLITVMVVISAVFAAFSSSIVRAAYSLFFTLFGMAGYYVLLGSGFLAVTQVVIYVGGILVLLMFGILLTDRPLKGRPEDERRRYIFSGIVGTLFILIVLFRIIFSTEWQGAETIAPLESSVRPLGEMLLGKYLLALEIAGVTLLLCLLGAAYLVRRQER